MHINKRAQLSLFVIVAIIIISSIAIFFLLKPNLPTNKEYSLGVGEVKENIDKCLEELTTEAIDKMSKQGGFVYPEESPYGILEFSLFGSEIDSKTAYAYYNGENVLIKHEGLEWQIKRNIEEGFNECVRFDEFGIEIQEDFPWAYAKLEKNSLSVFLNYSFTAKKADTIMRSSEIYSYKTKSQLGELRNVAEEITKQLEENQGMLSSDILNYGYNITLLHVDNSSSVFIIDDKDSKEYFMFGIGETER